MHALRPLAADALAEQDAQPGLRARARRHADAPARAHVRRRLRPRRRDVPRDARTTCAPAWAPPSRTRGPGGVALFVPDCTRETFVAGHRPRRSRRRRRPRAPLPRVDDGPRPRTTRRSRSTTRSSSTSRASRRDSSTTTTSTGSSRSTRGSTSSSRPGSRRGSFPASPTTRIAYSRCSSVGGHL